MTSKSMPPTSSHASSSPVMRSTSWPGGSQRRLDLGAEHQVGDERGDARHHCERRLAELLAHALRPAPHLHDLGAALAHLATRQLAGDAFAVGSLQHALDRLGAAARGRSCGRPAAASASRLRVGLRVDLAERDSAVSM